MKVLQQNEPKIFRQLKDKEGLLKNGNLEINPHFIHECFNALITKLSTSQKKSNKYCI